MLAKLRNYSRWCLVKNILLCNLLCSNYFTKSNADNQQSFSNWRKVGVNNFDSLSNNYGLAHQVVIGIKISGKTHTCAGSIISEDYILTAATCLYDNNDGHKMANPKNVIVTAGFAGMARKMDNMQTSFAWSFKIHKRYNADLYPSGYDVALVQLEQPFDLDPDMGLDSIRLVEPGLAVHSQALITGWDRQDSKQEKKVDYHDNPFEQDPSEDLKRVAVNLIPNEECEASFAGVGVHDIILTERQRCFIKLKDDTSNNNENNKNKIQADLGGGLTCLTANEEEPEPVLCGLLDGGRHHGSQEDGEDEPNRPIISVNVQNRDLNRWIVHNAWLPYDEDSFDDYQDDYED